MLIKRCCRNRFDVMRNRNSLRAAAALLAAPIALSACAMPASGPSAGRIIKAGEAAKPFLTNLQVFDLNDLAVQRATRLQQSGSLLEQFGDVAPQGTTVEPGDTVEVLIWEAPPAVLYGASTGIATGAVSRAPGIPEQVVDSTGQISVPFVGNVRVAGRTPMQIAADIESRLQGKAHQPQVVVRLTDNSSANVTVVGDVTNSRRMPLTPKGERLLDALASAGGAKQPVGKMLVQVTRGAHVVSAPLETVIRDPRQNIRLAADDVVTLLFQPYSFTALGAISNNAEIPFEGTGLTLAQALGRVGGLQDQRSDPKGVFIFRMEPADTANAGSSTIANNALVPVIYRVNMKDPAAFFLAQRFEIRNRDVLYVSNSPTIDLQKFLGLLSQAAFSLTGIGSVVP